MMNNLFKSLVEDAVSILSETINRIQSALETNRRLEREFEHHVLLSFKGAGKEKGFDCEASSMHAFPDIVCTHRQTRLKFGVEVKTGKSWQTNGNSIFTEIGEQDLQDIIVLFCKTSKPIEISWKRYEDVVVGVAITHSPRYTIKMNMDNDSNFFKEMNTSYRDFKRMTVNEKMEIVRRYYLLKEKTATHWWV